MFLQYRIRQSLTLLQFKNSVGCIHMWGPLLGVKWSFWRLSRKQNKPSPAQTVYFLLGQIHNTHTHTKQVYYTGWQAF